MEYTSLFLSSVPTHCTTLRMRELLYNFKSDNAQNIFNPTRHEKFKSILDCNFKIDP